MAAPKNKVKACVLYYGACVTGKSHAQRNLPGWNTAATKRMVRIADAVQSRQVRCFIVSPGIVPRIKGHGQYKHPIVERFKGVPVATIGQVAIPWLGYLVSPLFAVLAARKIARRRRIAAVIQYSYFPDAVIFGIWCRFVYGSRLVLDCEDVSVPSRRDWKRGSETRPIQQLWATVLMKLSIALAHKVIILSRKFLDVVPNDKAVIVSGCQRVLQCGMCASDDDAIEVLLCGVISKENGMDMFVRALELLGQNKKGENLRFKVCGSGKAEELRRKLSAIEGINVAFMGYLSEEDFEKMYAAIDVCLVLQNPTGRQGRYKVPSKGYEALCTGKVLLAGDMGDFADLPDDVCLHLRPYTAERMVELLLALDRKKICAMRKSALEYAKLNFDARMVHRRLRETLGI